jgi:hypothetical protein
MGFAGSRSLHCDVADDIRYGKVWLGGATLPDVSSEKEVYRGDIQDTMVSIVIGGGS